MIILWYNRKISFFVEPTVPVSRVDVHLRIAFSTIDEEVQKNSQTHYNLPITHDYNLPWREMFKSRTITIKFVCLKKKLCI